MEVSIVTRGQYSGGTELGTSPDDLIQLAEDVYGSGSTEYNRVVNYIGMYTHVCEVIIVYGEGDNAYNVLDYRVNSNAYDGWLYDSNLLGTNDLDIIINDLEDLGILELGELKFTNNVGSTVDRYHYDTDTSSTPLCQFAKCMDVNHLNMNLISGCICPQSGCEVFDNLILDFELC